jgi:hypothetical protein
MYKQDAERGANQSLWSEYGVYYTVRSFNPDFCGWKTSPKTAKSFLSRSAIYLAAEIFDSFE